MTEQTEKRRAGRPRLHPEGTTASDRARLADQARRDSGGHRMSLHLDEPAWIALQSLAEPRDRSGVIAGLILAAAKRKRRP